jgi:hypothetical protein
MLAACSDACDANWSVLEDIAQLEEENGIA